MNKQNKQTWMNRITDLNTATMVDYEFGTNARVHDGFLNAYQAIQQQV